MGLRVVLILFWVVSPNSGQAAPSSGLSLQSLNNHLLVLDQTLQSEVKALKNDKLAMETEINALKAKVALLEQQLQTSQTSKKDLAVVKSELFSTQTEVRRVSNDVFDLQSKLNFTEMALVHKDVGTNTKDILGLQSELAKVKANVSADHAACESTRTQLTKALSLLQRTESQTNATESEVVGLTSTVNGISGELQQCRNESRHNTQLLDGLTARVDSIRNSTMSSAQNITSIISKLDHLGSKIAFEVAMQNVISSMNNKTLKFDTVRVIMGGGYDPTTGIYTVPVSGTYLLWANVARTGHSWFKIFLKHNNQIIAKSYTDNPTDSMVSIISVALLHKGDNLSIIKDGRPHDVDGNLWSSYGGVLLSRSII